eukprot:211765_1
MSRKYIPPHLRSSSANRPPPPSTNDSYQSQRQQTNNNNGNRYRHGANPYRSNRRINEYSHNNSFQNSNNPNRFRYNSNQRRNQNNNYKNNNKCNNNRFNINNTNERTLEETTMSQNKIETINLDQYIVETQKYKQIIIQTLSEYADQEIAKLIYQICNDDTILIPNTFQMDEFLKYWFIVNKGKSVNKFKYDHRVDLYANYLQLIQRGAVASIKEYKPSSTAKLKLECKFIYRHPTDYMRFSFRSNGVREPNMKYASRGRVYCEDNHLSIYKEFHRGSNRIALMGTDKDGNTTERTQNIPSIPLNTELSVVMIDDGNKINTTYCSDDGVIYKLEFDSNKISKYHRVIAFNRELQGNIVDITYLQVSVINNHE